MGEILNRLIGRKISIIGTGLEISPSEPLHDLKGHLGNIIEEALCIATGDVIEELKKVKKAVLTKETVRCSDLRKAVILMYLKLKDSILTD